MPVPGDRAPSFSGPTASGEALSLQSLLEQAPRAVLVYFYPKDDTPGCTKQACNLRDNMADLEAAGILVVGVSPDDEASHERFSSKHALPFPLIADPDREILKAYGAWGEKNLYGRKSVGVKRTSFLIGSEGTVLHVFKRPKTADHAAEVLAKLAQLEAAKAG